MYQISNNICQKIKMNAISGYPVFHCYIIRKAHQGLINFLLLPTLFLKSRNLLFKGKCLSVHTSHSHPFELQRSGEHLYETAIFYH